MTGLQLTSLGMVTNVGYDVVTACASQRAGLVRNAPLDDVWAYDPSALEIRVTGAPIKGIADGFVQTGKWVRLALLCLEDLARYGRLPPPEDTAFWRTTGLLWVLPELAFERFGWPEPETPHLLERYCGQLLRDLARVPFQLLPGSFIASGPAGAPLALQQAARVLDGAGPLRRLIVLASDSWLDHLSLRLLIGENRLKTPERATGLCPGEAAAGVLVEPTRQAQTRGAPREANILGVATRPAPEPVDTEPPSLSRARRAPDIARQLAAAVAEVLDAAGDPRPFRGDILLDLNGEDWKARVWGHARPMLSKHLDPGHTKEICPAISFGDIGAASGVAALCVAARSFSRGYATTDRILSCSISDSGETGAVLVGREASIATRRASSRAVR
jgi:3-oxoacyl-[acyl-carrier-protein] synthase-1